MIEVFILSIIQGVTEFLPVSSSSHLIIVSDYLYFEKQNLTLDISLHIGSFLAVITYFSKDIINLVRNKDLFSKLIISSFPIIIVGYFLVKYNLIDHLRNIKIIGWTTIIFGILLYVSDKFKFEKKLDKNFTVKSAIFIGILQILSLVPGVSRSGITITAARLLNFDRVDSAKISFLLSIPTLGAVTFFGINNLINQEDLSFSLLNLISILLSFVFSYLTIKYFLQFIKRFSLYIFVVYIIILGILILSLNYL